MLALFHFGLETQGDWSEGLKVIYGFATADALEAAWLDWLKSPASKLAKPALPPPPPLPNAIPFIPPVQLSNDEPTIPPLGLSR